MTKHRSLLTAACLLGLALIGGRAAAQYYPIYGYQPPRARLSPYLNLARTNNGTSVVDPAINYHLGTVPERERRFNESLFGTRIQSLEEQQALRNFGVTAPSTSDLPVPPVPVAGRPPGSRASGAYFRLDAIHTLGGGGYHPSQQHHHSLHPGHGGNVR